MAAYRASRHEATKFTPIYLVLGREVRAPVDLVYDTPETTAPVSYASYADEMDDRMREAYALVREHLKVAAERNKCTYDLRVRTRQYKVGTGFTTLTHDSWPVARINGDVSLLGPSW